MTRAAIYAAIDAERDRQADRWKMPHYWGEGDCSSRTIAPVVKVAVLSEECGEVARAVLELDPAHLRTELVQVAAVAVAWLESLE
jgi:NTP pyrophosphatase (non-canonical NTP hydrolase)